MRVLISLIWGTSPRTAVFPRLLPSNPSTLTEQRKQTGASYLLSLYLPKEGNIAVASTLFATQPAAPKRRINTYFLNAYHSQLALSSIGLSCCESSSWPGLCIKKVLPTCSDGQGALAAGLSAGRSHHFRVESCMVLSMQCWAYADPKVPMKVLPPLCSFMSPEVLIGNYPRVIIWRVIRWR